MGYLSRSCSWRIVKENKVLCGDNDEIEACTNKINTLSYGRIKDIYQTFVSDLTILFDNDIRVDYFSNSLNDNQLIIIARNKISFELTVDGWFKENHDDHVQTLSKIDSFISEYSEECEKRWKKVVPNSSENECDSCFYFGKLMDIFIFGTLGYVVTSNRRLMRRWLGPIQDANFIYA